MGGLLEGGGVAKGLFPPPKLLWGGGGGGGGWHPHPAPPLSLILRLCSINHGLLKVE